MAAVSDYIICFGIKKPRNCLDNKIRQTFRQAYKSKNNKLSVKYLLPFCAAALYNVLNGLRGEFLMKRLVLLLLCAVMLLPAAVSAETASAEQLTVSGADKKLTDANHLTYTECETLNIKADNKIGSLYIIFLTRLPILRLKAAVKARR